MPAFASGCSLSLLQGRDDCDFMSCSGIDVEDLEGRETKRTPRAELIPLLLLPPLLLLLLLLLVWRLSITMRPRGRKGRARTLQQRPLLVIVDTRRSPPTRHGIAHAGNVRPGAQE